jgi:hypothetical protein
LKLRNRKFQFSIFSSPRLLRCAAFAGRRFTFVFSARRRFFAFRRFRRAADLAGFLSADLLAPLDAVELLAVEDFAEEDLPPAALRAA